MPDDPEAAFDGFAGATIPRLRRRAQAWCRDPYRADDLGQSALERVCASWPRVSRRKDAFTCTRAAMTRLLISEQRRTWRSRERLTDAVPEVANGAADPEGGWDVMAAVRALPPRQRAVLEHVGRDAARGR